MVAAVGAAVAAQSREIAEATLIPASRGFDHTAVERTDGVAGDPIVRPSDLPHIGTSLVARSRELADLARLLAAHPIVTLTGPGGVGKTRLAIECAHELRDRHPDGVRLAELAALDAASVAAAVSMLVGVTAGSGDPVTLLIEQLGERRVLILLDNCEHVVDAVASLAHRVVSRCPNVRLLCTGREPLGLAAEVTFPVRPLAPSTDAVRLFVDRAAAADPEFTLQDPDTVAELCRRLDGVPLAIELAAPWVRALSPAELLPRLVDRFDVLTATRRDLPPRQRSMRATVEWSHHLLTDPQRVLFRRLAAFPGTFDVAAAEQVCGFDPLRPAAVVALLVRLTERSMVVVERASGGGSRFRLLETLRDFALERLDEANEAAACRRGHVEAFLARAEAFDDARRRTGSDTAAATLVPDTDNYRGALSWSLEHDPATALRLAAALEPLWMIRSVAEGRRWLQLALDRAPEPTPARARALIVPPLVVAGGLAWTESRAMIESSIAIYEGAGDETGVAMARLTLALSAVFNGELAEAERAVTEALRRHADLALPLFRARAVTYLGAALSFRRNRQDEGMRLLVDGAARSRAIGDGWGWGMALTVLGLAEVRARLRQQAREHLRTAVREVMQAGVTAAAVGGLGQLAAVDDPRRGLILLESAWAVRERTGVPRFPMHIDRQLSSARETALRTVPAEVAARCRAEARSLTTEEVLAHALAETEQAEHGLTQRQREIALLVAEGLSNRDIAARLQLSVRTVETHVNNVLTGLGLHNRVQLAAWVRDTGLRSGLT